MNNPHLAFDDQGLGETLKARLVDAGKQKVADELDQAIDKELSDELPEEAKEILDTDKVKEGLKGLFK